MDISKAPKRLRISAEERFRLVSLFRQSGLTHGEFAQQQGIKIHTLHQWLYRSAAKRRRKAAFQEVSLPAFASAPGWAAEVVLDSGMTLRVGTSAKPDLICVLIEKLRRSSC